MRNLFKIAFSFLWAQKIFSVSFHCYVDSRKPKNQLFSIWSFILNEKWILICFPDLHHARGTGNLPPLESDCAGSRWSPLWSLYECQNWFDLISSETKFKLYDEIRKKTLFMKAYWHSLVISDFDEQKQSPFYTFVEIQ